MAPVLFLFYIQAVLDTLDTSNWSVPKFRYKADKTVSGRSYRARGIDFWFPFSVYADDTAALFESRDDLTRGTIIIRAHFKRFGLKIHVGSDDKKSKTEAMLFPRPRAVYSDYDTSNIAFSDGAYIHFTTLFKYLGIKISSDLSDEADVNARIAAASGAFGKLNCILLSKKSSRTAKRTAYMAIVIPILIYGAEAWNLTEKLYNKLRKFHNYHTRKMCHLSLHHCIKHHISASDIHERLGLLSIDAYITRRHLRWAGHVARMPDSRLPRRFLTCWVRNKRPTGAPQFTYGRGLKKSLNKLDIDPLQWYDLAQDRPAWRNLTNAQF